MDSAALPADVWLNNVKLPLIGSSVPDGDDGRLPAAFRETGIRSAARAFPVSTASLSEFDATGAAVGGANIVAVRLAGDAAGQITWAEIAVDAKNS